MYEYCKVRLSELWRDKYLENILKYIVIRNMILLSVIV